MHPQIPNRRAEYAIFAHIGDLGLLRLAVGRGWVCMLIGVGLKETGRAILRMARPAVMKKLVLFVFIPCESYYLSELRIAFGT